MSITIKKIAEMAQTSRGTVDRVLNNRGKVEATLALKIKEIAEAYGYSGNEYASALANSKKIYKIGIILNSLKHQFYERVKTGILSTLKKQIQFEYVLLENEDQDIDTQIKHIEHLSTLSLDGLIVTPQDDLRIQKALNELQLPSVLLVHDLDVDLKISFVGCNYESNGQLAADLTNSFASNEKILVISGPKHIRSYQKRIAGFKNQLSATHHVDLLYTNNRANDVKKQVTSYLINNDVSFVYFAAYGIRGLFEALETKHMKPKVIAVDENQAVIDALASNQVAVTITQQPEKQGMRAVLMMVDKLKFNKVPLNKIHYIGNKIKVKSSNFNEK